MGIIVRTGTVYKSIMLPFGVGDLGGATTISRKMPPLIKENGGAAVVAVASNTKKRGNRLASYLVKTGTPINYGFQFT